MLKENFTPEQFEKLCIILCQICDRIEREDTEAEEQEISNATKLHEESKDCA